MKRFIEEYINVQANLHGMPFSEFNKLPDEKQEAISEAAWAVTREATALVAKGYLQLPLAVVSSSHPDDDSKIQQYEICEPEGGELQGDILVSSIGVYTEQQVSQATVQEFVGFVLKIWADVAARHKVPFTALHVSRNKAFRETEETFEPITG